MRFNLGAVTVPPTGQVWKFALSAIGGIVAILAFNGVNSPRPLIGGKGSGTIINGAGWWLLGSSIGGHIGRIIDSGRTT